MCLLCVSRSAVSIRSSKKWSRRGRKESGQNILLALLLESVIAASSSSLSSRSMDGRMVAVVQCVRMLGDRGCLLMGEGTVPKL